MKRSLIACTLQEGQASGTGNARKFRMGDMLISEELVSLDDKSLSLRWRATDEPDTSSLGVRIVFRDYTSSIKLTRIAASGMTLIKWEGSVTASKSQAELVHMLVERSYRDLFSALQTYCTTLKPGIPESSQEWTDSPRSDVHRSDCANLEFPMLDPANSDSSSSISRDSEDSCQGPSTPRRSNSHNGEAPLALRRSVSLQQASSSLLSIRERLQSLNLRTNSQPSSSSSCNSLSSEVPLSQSEPSGSTTARVADSNRYTGLGLALEKSTSGDWGPRAESTLPSDFARFAQQSFKDARSSTSHTRRSMERINSTRLPHYLQLQALSNSEGQHLPLG